MKMSKESLEKLLERTGLRGITDELLPLPENEYNLSPDNPRLKDYIINVYPRTLDDVRALIGTSLENGERHKEQMNLPEYMSESCARAKSDAEEAPEVIRDIANRIVHFPCDETEELIIHNTVYKKAAEKVLEMAQGLPVLLAENLVIKDNEIYTISVPVAIFDQITIYGSGGICFDVSQVKLSANTFNYYPNSKGEN